jgi:uncharacterized integral membrane protein
MADDDGKEPARKEENVTRLVIGIVILVVVAAFVIANIRTVKVGYVFGSYKTPLIFVLIVTFVLGALVDRLLVIRGRNKD